MDFNFKEGEVLLVDKPLEWTSFDIVKKIKFTIKEKVGHAGTLDPLATGLLIICTGKATKKIEEYMGMPKEYTGKFYLGASTPSFDAETEPDAHYNIEGISKKVIDDAAAQFIGEKEQMPPVFSAIKIKGQRMYKLAREGKEVEVKPRIVQIDEFEIINVDLPIVTFRIVCSKGTYIRSIAHDFGKAVGAGAYLYSLRRTKIGQFSVDDAWDINDFVNLVKDKKKE